MAEVLTYVICCDIKPTGVSAYGSNWCPSDLKKRGPGNLMPGSRLLDHVFENSSPAPVEDVERVNGSGRD